MSRCALVPPVLNTLPTHGVTPAKAGVHPEIFGVPPAGLSVHLAVVLPPQDGFQHKAAEIAFGAVPENLSILSPGRALRLQCSHQFRTGRRCNGQRRNDWPGGQGAVPRLGRWMCRTRVLPARSARQKTRRPEAVSSRY